MKDYCTVDWKSLVYYSEDSPSGLRWKTDRKNCSGSTMAAKDAVAGSLSNKGYWVIPSSGSYYKVHRVVWLLHHKDISTKFQIDHKDRNRENNKIENLREIALELNRRNISKQSNNSSGITGVHWRNTRGITYAVAKYHKEGSAQIKLFSVNRLGLLESFALACKHREDAIKELNQLGYGYSNTHGK